MQTAHNHKQDAAISRQLDAIHSLMHEGEFQQAIKLLSPIVQAMDTTSPTSQEVFALLLVADAQRFSGLITDAYKNYVVAAELDPNQADKIRPHILKCLPEMETILDKPIFQQHLLEYLEEKTLHNRAIDPHATKLLVRNYDLENDQAEIDFNAIICDPLLLACLKHLVLANPYVENFIQMLRQELFQLAVENGTPNELLPMIIAMAEHAELVEYASPVSENEKVLLLGLQTLIETHLAANGAAEEIIEPLLLFLMYEPIHKSTVAQYLKEKHYQEWPAPVQNLFREILTNPKKEARLAATIPSLANIESDVSLKVMEQYQEHPYPRWRDVFATSKKLPYLDIYPELRGRVATKKLHRQKLNCLIAGCGTGHQPIWLAANCKNVDILALDLSRPSIAYGMRQGAALGHTKSIKFVQGDILDLDQLDRQFEVIQCSGVLHHMEDPELGLERILARLADEGLLMLGLYSRTARDVLGINHIRDNQAATTLEELRAQRREMLADPTHRLLSSRDFYTTSECRDLLNHVQEHQFDLSEIKTLLEKYGLTFLGFNGLDKVVTNEYKKQYPSDPNLLSLDNWRLFEQKNPHIFKGMYQFHCQKAPSH